MIEGIRVWNFERLGRFGLTQLASRGVRILGLQVVP